MATTSTPSKTLGTAAVSWANGDLASAAQYISAAIDVSGKFAIGFSIQLARRTGTAFTAGWPNIRLEASAKSSGNDTWVPRFIYQPALGATIVNTTLNGAVSAAATTFVVTSATNIAIGDYLYLGDSATANYELVRVKAVSGTTITPEEAVTYAHANAAMVTDQAESIYVPVDCAGIARMRVVVDNANSGQAMAAQVFYVLFDSISNV